MAASKFIEGPFVLPTHMPPMSRIRGYLMVSEIRSIADFDSQKVHNKVRRSPRPAEATSSKVATHQPRPSSSSGLSAPRVQA